MKTKNNPRYYVAYGSNLNIKQMASRCPTAKLYATGVIKDYELQFKGQPTGSFATIAKNIGSEVPVAVWEIQRSDEYFLDRYEGYPSHYFKKDVPVDLNDGREINAMVYIMNLKMNFGLPSTHYYRTVHQGYLDCNLDTTVLNNALGKSAQKFYALAINPISMQMQFNFSKKGSSDDDDEKENISEDEDEEMTDGDEELDDEYDEENDIVNEADEDISEEDSYYFSSGMRW